MHINKKFSFLILSILLPSFSHAQVFINEIMYDLSGADSGREWVEVYNAGASSIDLSTYKFSEATTNHTIKNISGNANIASGAYAIIADDTNKFLLDWPGFSGNLFDSSFSLNNSGATLTLKDSSSTVLDQVTYTPGQGASGDGNTLQKSSSGWIVAVPTPGLLNSLVPIVSTPTTPVNATSTDSIGAPDSAGGPLSSHYSVVSISQYIEHEKFSITAGRDRLVMVGAPIEFEAKANLYDNNTHYSWSFSDGTVGDGKKISHTYEYSGDYVVIVNGSSGEDRYVSRVKVKVIKPKLSIEAANEQYIKIKNDSGYEVNLFGSEIESRGAIFKFPKDTIILSGASNIFSSKVTNLYPSTVSDVVFKNINSVLNPVVQNPENQKELAELYEKTVYLQKQLTAMAGYPRVEMAEPSPQGSGDVLVRRENVATTFLAPIPSNSNRSWIEILKQFFFGSSR